MSDTLRTEIRMFAEMMDPDRLNYMDCPECGGVNKLMVVVAENGRGYYFKCFRDSCGVLGVTGGKRWRYSHNSDKDKKTRSVYSAPKTVPCELGDFRMRFHKYGLCRSQMDELCSGYAYVAKAYIFPIRSPVGRIRGHVERSFMLSHNPVKTRTCPYESSGSLLAWYWSTSPVLDQPLVIVEDQISTARLQPHVSAVALLGTHLTLEGEEELRREVTCVSGARPLVVALDRDATATGVSLARRLSGLPNVNARLIPLSGPDIKDMGPNEFKAFVDRVRR